jgi:hypothetical protein
MTRRTTLTITTGIALVPLALAIITGLVSGKGIFNESSASGSLIWFSFLSFPLALSFLFANAIYALYKRARR